MLLKSLNSYKSKLSSASLASYFKFNRSYHKLERNLYKNRTLTNPSYRTLQLTSVLRMSTTSGNRVVKVYNEIIKPVTDKREYRGLVLDNKMKCLLISDPTTDKSAASVDVHVGSLVDTHPGLAHFCEHMLFLGSKKFPQENTFAKYIEEHAGSSNAYTGSENTNYHFEIANANLKEALDIFSQFFISPLFDPSSTDREINAVNSENHKNLQIDGWRLDQLDKSLCKPDHPYSKFGTGNVDTLKHEPEKNGINIRDELIKFHTKYYSSNIMTLCILGAEPLDKLQEYVLDMFAEVPNKNIDYINFEKNPYSEDSFKHSYHVVPIQEVHHLSMNFQLPDYRDFYESNPAHYISHLVGHEGPGSLLSELKAKGWCNGLYSGPKTGARGFQFYTINLDLTEEGVSHSHEILKLCFQYLNLLRSEGVRKWINDELTTLGKINFDYKDKEKPISYVTTISGDMHVFKMEHALSGNYLMTKFEPDVINEILDQLRPEKMKVTLISKHFDGKTDLTEKWYGTQYKKEKIDEGNLEDLKNCGLNPAFKLPEKNEFIPNDLSLVKYENGVEKFPTIVYKSPITRLWYKGDDKFLLPKASGKFDLKSPFVTLDPKHYNMSALFIDLLSDSLTEYTYAAELAGLKYRINLNNYGIQIDVNGYDNKFHILLDKIIERISSFKVDEKRFNILKDNYKRNLMNFQAQQPYSHAIYYMAVLLSEKGWTKAQLLAAIDDFTVEELQQFIPKFFTQGLFVESIIFGNMTKERAIEISEKLEERLKNTSLMKVDALKPLLPLQINNFRCVKMPNKSEFVFIENNKIHKTVGIEVYFETHDEGTRSNALTELFCQIINESTYHVLRTQEQLGYIVASGLRRFNGVQGVRFILQSDRSPDVLEERIEAFLATVKQTLETMTDEQFQCHKDALAVNKLEEPKRISKQCDVYWGEITTHLYHFNRENVEVEDLKNITKADIIDFYNNLLSADAPQRKKLSVYINSVEMNDAVKEKVKDRLIEDISEFKTHMPLAPLPKPYMKL